MKLKKSPLLIISLLVGCLACDNDNDANPEPAVTLRAETISYGDTFRELKYNNNNQVESIESGYIVMNGDTVVSNISFAYEGDKLVAAHLPDSWRMEYTYNPDGTIAETKEYAGDVYVQTYVFEYFNNKKLKQWTTYQEIESVVQPVHRGAYHYDAKGNADEIKQYGFSNGTPVIISTLRYSNFDNRKNSESLFWTFTANPFVIQHVNNPGKMEVINPVGHVDTQHYTYAYNAQNYAVSQTFVDADLVVLYTFSEH